MTEKLFAKGIKIKEFGNYGSLKLSINKQQLSENVFNGDWLNCIINKSKSGNWYVEIDTWKPNKNDNVVSFDDIKEDEEIPF